MSDLEPVVGIVARRTGHPVEVVREIVEASWGILQARQEWEVSEALERGIRIGIHTMEASGAVPDQDGPR